MLGMSQEQLLGLLRQVLPIVGTLLVSLGFMKPETFSAWTATIMTIAGPLMIIWSAVWSLIDKTRDSMIAKADVIAKDPTSPLKALVMTNTVEGREITNSTPGNTTVTAGTPEAAAVVRA